MTLVHGLEGDLVEPTWDPLRLDEADAVLRGFPEAGGARRVIWHSPRPYSSAALVLPVRGRRCLLVKRHDGRVRSPESLAEEHRFAEHLRRLAVPVPRVLADADGATALRRDGWTYEVHERSAGVDLYREAPSWQPPTTAGHAREAGGALARLHLAAAGYGAPPRRRAPLQPLAQVLDDGDLLGAIDREVAARPALEAALEGPEVSPHWREEVAEALQGHRERLGGLPGELPRSWAHNDWHVSNLFWSSAGARASVVGVIDFGLADRTSATFDLATAIERNAVAWLALRERPAEIARPGLATSLVRGYLAERPLEPVEAEALAALLPLVHVGFALSELEYFGGILRSRQAVRTTYETFLLGHARWFSTSAGQLLLDAVAKAAGSPSPTRGATARRRACH